MNAGLNLLTALFLLSPGFGVFAGVYLTGLRRPFRPAPAAPGSLLALALVTIGALTAHAISALPYAAQEVLCATVSCTAVGFQPNPYVTLIDPEVTVTMPGVSMAIALIHLLIVALIGLGIGRFGMWLATKSQRFQSLFYGWTTELIDLASTRFHVINAFALTDVTKDELSLGYEGTLLDLRQDANGKLLSATLRDVQAFVIELKSEGVQRRRVPRAQPIPFMVLEAENVKNLALSIYFDTASAVEFALTDAPVEKMSKAEQVGIFKALQAAQTAAKGSTAASSPPIDDHAAGRGQSETSPPSPRIPVVKAPVRKGTRRSSPITRA
ncbi:MAG: hypothetical protein Q8R45_14080 [Brevundimonas sp.]|uniref:hypothetical protein n=1 Tax=Brevundimonas sp. TaxID=1871086 RepID=UPI002717CFDB|nr:hypothetical protein [Brevundimonas sp.]MDO9078361.1 hypothetical protein [Brevundimonas sp.]MDP3658077.1 hypothetical protein [Brevundimonas sp.]MDZ4062392.1 hypothetical protein [Brevundimonas sp.]